jgi:homoserine O-succinyltransferase/O-acetyltransferase
VPAEPAFKTVRQRRAPVASGPLRVGIINVMPRAETYEPHLLRPLRAADVPIEPIWIRLESHVYSSSDAEHVQRYSTFGALGAPLDGLILTGAPVEELAFEDVRYFCELRAILEQVRQSGVSTLGLCWGGLALGHLMGVSKILFGRKLFGVFEQRRLDAWHAITKGFGASFPCAHSRHSGVGDTELERARDAGLLHLLAHGPDTGYTMFESFDGLYLAHLGHPEYPAERLAEEWQRDTRLGRTDLDPPRNYDPESPKAPWAPHCDRLFSNWLQRLETLRTTRRPAWPPGSLRLAAPAARKE